LVEGALQTPSTLGLRLNPINPKGLDDPHWMQYPGPIQTNKQTSKPPDKQILEIDFEIVCQ